MRHDPVVLLAKFVPDLRRMEPRNVGVIVWDNGDIAHRFLGEQHDRIRPPEMVPQESRHAYREWVKYWGLMLKRPRIRGRDGRVVYRESPEFMEALAGKSKPAFVLVPSAKLFTSLNGEIEAAADEFYAALVDTTPKHHEDQKIAAKALRRTCRDVLQDVVNSLPSRNVVLAKNEAIIRVRNGKPQNYHFDFTFAPFGEGKDRSAPSTLFQSVVLSNTSSVFRAAHTLKWAMDSESLSATDAGRFRCAALVDTSLHVSDRDEAEGALADLSSDVFPVIDMARDGAWDHLRSLADI
ncbi:hypothetical protein AYO47_03525 [Planctomyces sp. SCGC AG-212-M04]|nr:hypothetical protein AYO47_03525 [Planctomyces sp. SCGC AG-212-M04]